MGLYLVLSAALAMGPGVQKQAPKREPVKQAGPLRPRLEPLYVANSPHNAVEAAYLDALDLPKGEACFYRYWWVPYERGSKEYNDLLPALQLQINLLSDQGFPYSLVFVSPNLIRVDVREVGWDKRLDVYEKFARIDAFFHDQATALQDLVIEQYWPGSPRYEKGVYDVRIKAGKSFPVYRRTLPPRDVDGLRKILHTEVPILNAEWWFVQTARQVSIRNKQEGVGYYEWLGLKSRNDFFKLTGTDEKVAARLFQKWAEVVAKSGISQQSRQVFAYGAVNRRVWGTLDTFTQQGRGQPKRNLRDGEIAHDAEEWYGFLPNGLWVTFLANNKGEAQESAPDKIGPDKSPLNVGNDGRVHANLSCIRCHGVDKDFLKPIDGWARKAFRQGGVLRLAEYDKKVYLELKSLYLRDLNTLLDDDRTAYLRAVQKVTATDGNPKGLTAAQITNLYGQAWNRYVEQDVDLKTAARELGVKPERLLEQVKRHAGLRHGRGGSDLILAEFLDGGKLTRLEWEDSYSLAAVLAAGLQPPEQPKEVKPNPKE